MYTYEAPLQIVVAAQVYLQFASKQNKNMHGLVNVRDLHLHQNPSIHKGNVNLPEVLQANMSRKLKHGRHKRQTDISHLDRSIDFTDHCRSDLGRGDREIPIACKSLWFREGDISVIEGSKDKTGVTAEDDGRDGDGDEVLHGQGDGEDCHEGLVGHWVENCADDALHVKPASYPAIQLFVEETVERKWR